MLNSKMLFLIYLCYIELTSTQSSVIPWDLWIENAQANLKTSNYYLQNYSPPPYAWFAYLRGNWVLLSNPPTPFFTWNKYLGTVRAIKQTDWAKV